MALSLMNGAEFDLTLVPAHLGAVGGIVHSEFQHSRQMADVMLVQPDAGGADDAFQHQRGFADMFALSAHKALLQIRPVVQFQSAQRFRDQILRPARGRGAMAIKVGQTRSHNRFRDRLAAVATHRLSLAVDHCRVMGSRWNRQAAMKARGFSRNRTGGHEGFSSA